MAIRELEKVTVTNGNIISAYYQADEYLVQTQAADWQQRYVSMIANAVGLSLVGIFEQLSRIADALEEKKPDIVGPNENNGRGGMRIV